MPPRKYNQTRAACMFCEAEPCVCDGPVRAKPRKVDLEALLAAPIPADVDKPIRERRARLAVVQRPPVAEEPPVVEPEPQQPRHSPGKLTSAKQQKPNLPVRSGLTRVTREVIEEPVWHDDSLDEGSEPTEAEALMILFESGLISLESMIDHKDRLGVTDVEANKLIWRIERGKEA